MNFVHNIWLILAVISSWVCAGDIDIDDFKFADLDNIVKEHIEANPGIMDVSEKDIAVLLGYTGSGKSTLLNFLSEQKLIGDEFNGYELAEPHAPGACIIGNSEISQTRLPQSIAIGNLHYYDFAGLSDNRGTLQNLVNACLMKRILEHARSVRFIIVTSHSEITTERAAVFQTLLSGLKKLTNQNLEPHSIIVMTRSPFTAGDTLKRFLNKFAGENISPFIENDKVFSMLMPSLHAESQQISEELREQIISKVSTLEPTKIQSIAIDNLYTAPSKERLHEIFSEQLKLVLQHFIVASSNWASMNSWQLRNHLQNLEQEFRHTLEDIFYRDSLMLLLKPIAEEAYDKARKAFASEIELQRQNLLQRLKEALINKIAEEKRLEEMRIEALRIENEKKAENERQRFLALQKQEQERRQREWLKQEQERRALEEKQKSDRERQRQEDLKDHNRWKRRYESRKVYGPVTNGGWTVYDGQQNCNRQVQVRKYTCEQRCVYVHPDNPNMIKYGEWFFCSSGADQF